MPLAGLVHPRVALALAFALLAFTLEAVQPVAGSEVDPSQG